MSKQSPSTAALFPTSGGGSSGGGGSGVSNTRLARGRSMGGPSPYRPALARPMHHKEDPKQLLASLTENAQFGPAIKAVYDRSWQNDFRSYMDANIEKKDAEIRETCNENFEEFIGSVDSLLSVKKDMTDLRGLITSLNQKVNESGERVVERAKALAGVRLIRHNINVTMHVLRSALQVFDLVAKALEQIETKRYFSALKTISQLQHHHLPRFQELDFCRQLEDQLPMMTYQIRESVKQEFSNWLLLSRSRAKNLGALAMTQTDNTIKSADKKERRRRKRRLQQLLQASYGNPYVISSAGGGGGEGGMDGHSGAGGGGGGGGRGGIGVGTGNNDDDQNDGDDDGDEEGVQQGRQGMASTGGEKKLEEQSLFDKVDLTFAPVYQCLHIHESLNLAPQFHKMYRDKRLALCLQAVELPGKMSKEDFMGAYMGYLANIAGFFIIEDSITKSGSALMTRTELDGLWEKSLIKIKSVLAEHIDQITDVSDFLALKYALVLFARTMESYSLSPNAIHDFLMVTTDRFERLILSRLHDEVKDALSNDKFEPLTVSNHSEYRSKVLAFGLQDPSLHVTFPATLPFSQSVPQVSKAVRAYASAYFEYAAHLPTSLESVICKSVDTVLITEVNAALNAMVNTAVTMHISQAVQISINAAFLAEACLYMQVYLSSYSEPTTGDEGPPVARLLNAHTQLLQTRTRCQDLLFELIDNKIDQFLSLLSTIDWMPSNITTEPSDCVVDLITYLETTLACLVFVPDAVREAVHFTSCKHIASVYHNILVNQVKKFNQMSVYNLEKDVRALEDFASRCPVANLAETFSELRQFTDLMLSGNIDVYSDDVIRASRYPHLNPDVMIKVLDKFKDLGLFTTMPKGLAPIKRKQVDALISKIKKFDSKR